MVIFWRISNSRRILRRELLNIRRELLDSLREFSNSRRNLDENCWIRGENPVKSRQPNCIPTTVSLSSWTPSSSPSSGFLLFPLLWHLSKRESPFASFIAAPFHLTCFFVFNLVVFFACFLFSLIFCITCFSCSMSKSKKRERQK